jgi:hypothetical protein
MHTVPHHVENDAALTPAVTSLLARQVCAGALAS